MLKFILIKEINLKISITTKNIFNQNFLKDL